MEQYLNLERDRKFEDDILQATEGAIERMSNDVSHEVRLRYITHIFAKTLDEIADQLVKQYKGDC